MKAEKREKLFKAIVVMGAAMSAPACDDRCHRCVPTGDAPVDVVATGDAGPDAPTDGPTDAPVDVVLIL